MMNHIVYLALGSNMGNRLTNLKAAASNLTPQMAVKNRSSVYETPPWGFTVACPTATARKAAAPTTAAL